MTFEERAATFYAGLILLGIAVVIAHRAWMIL
jgi:hypothetical protein